MDDVSSIAELCHSEAIFTRAVDGLLVKVRRAMSVPEQADADVEAEFSALRTDFDAFLPEFRELFARLLLDHIEPAQLPLVLETLGAEVEQRYLQAAQRIDAEFEQLLGALSQNMRIVAQQALAAR